MAYLKEGSEPPKTGKGATISPLMSRFIDEYLSDTQMNATQAVIRAGYKTRNPRAMAEQLMKHPLIIKGIEGRTAARREKFKVSEDYVIGKLVQIIEDTEGGNPTAALRGLELLGKHMGMYKDRQEISGPDGKAIQMEQKVKEDVADFTSKLTRLAASSGEGAVVEGPKPRGNTAT